MWQFGMPCLATDERLKAVAADCSAAQPVMTTLPLSRHIVHAGVSSDARAGCTNEGWTYDV